MAAIEHLWPHAESAPPLETAQAHVWAVTIDESPVRTQEHWEVLTDDERSRADRFRFDEPRDRFVATRAALRRLLADYLGVDPIEIVLSFDAYGKPSVDPRVHQSSLRFNVAHSAGLAVIAFTTDCDVGADVECLRSVRQAEGITARYFHPAESADVLAGQQYELIERFFRCWTQKEAVIKAVGTGLQYPLERFRVPVLRPHPCWIDLPSSSKTKSARLWLQPFVPCTGYLGALATVDDTRECVFRSLVT